MDIEAIVKKYFDPCAVYMVEGREAMRAALTELSETHAIELRAYEATVANLEQRVRELELKRFRNGLPLESIIENLERRNEWLSESITRMVSTQPVVPAAPQPKKEGE